MIISKAIEKHGSEYISCFQPKDLKLHPIVAGHKSLTECLSNIVDILLNPPLSKIKSYVKDDFDFHKKFKRNLTKNSKLVSFDVPSLCINIPHELGFKAVEYWLDTYPELIHSRFNKSFILEALKLILKITIFIKLSELLSIILAPTYAALVMRYPEIQFYKKCKKEFGVNNVKYIEENWHRFLDDC